VAFALQQPAQEVVMVTLKAYLPLLIALAVVTVLPGCEVVEGIFKAGMAAGIFLVVLVVGLAFFLVGKIRRRV
jgi:hypothetical protein